MVAAGWKESCELLDGTGRPPARLPQLWLIPHVCTGQEQLHKNLTSSWSAPRVTEGKGCWEICQTLKLAREKLAIFCALCWFCTAVHFQPSIKSLPSWCHTPLFSPPLDQGGINFLAPEEVVPSSQWLQENSPSCPHATENALTPPLSPITADQWWMGRHTSKPPHSGVGYPLEVISSHLTGMKG